MDEISKEEKDYANYPISLSSIILILQKCVSVYYMPCKLTKT